MFSINSLSSCSANDSERSNCNNCHKIIKESIPILTSKSKPFIICSEDDIIDLEKTFMTEPIPRPKPRPRPIIMSFEDDDIDLETVYMDIVYNKKNELDLDGKAKVSLVSKSHRLSVIYENLSKYNSNWKI